MSDSELSSTHGALPPAATIEATLQRIVCDALMNDEEISIKSARSQAETELGLETDFFKNDALWKDRSKAVINAATQADTPVKAKEPAVAPVAKASAKTTVAKKRKSDEIQEKPKKRVRKAKLDASEDESEAQSKPASKGGKKPRVKPHKLQTDVSEEPGGASSSKPTKKPVQRMSSSKDERMAPGKPRSQLEGDSDHDSPHSDAPEAAEDDDAPAISNERESDDESVMSVLIDEPPTKARPKARKKSSDAPAKAKSTTDSKRTNGTKELPANEEEIKRLQSWLVKCGLRKLWHKELAPYDTQKAKISHLKSMLADVGMTGRYSAEKAKSIREARELKEEIEAAKEFEAQWGQKGNEEGSADEEKPDNVSEVNRRPGGRILPKGLVDFGDSGDDDSD